MTEKKKKKKKKKKRKTLKITQKYNMEPEHMTMVLIAYVNNERSVATAHPRSLTRDFTVRTHIVEN